MILFFKKGFSMNKCKKDFKELKTDLFMNLDRSIQAHRILCKSLKPVIKTVAESNVK